jgi:hypothetical protein
MTKLSSGTAAAALLCIAAAAATSISANSGFATVAGWRPAERCAGAITVADAKDDTRSWTLPAPPGGALSSPSADLRRLELRATAKGVCVRWTTAAPAPPGTVLVFVARGPFVRQPGGGAVAYAYGLELKVRETSAWATYGLDRLGSRAPRVLRVRAGRTGPAVSVFVPRAELDRPPANMPDRPPFPYRAFTFEVRVISAPDSSGHSRVDFWPQERSGSAAYIEGRLCVAPCRDPRFLPG